VIAVAESTAPARPSPPFLQGQASVPLVEALTARALALKDGQIVQATVQSQGEQLTLLLRGRQIGVPRAAGWEVGQRLSFQVQTHADGSVTLQLLGPGGKIPFPLASNAPGAPTAQTATPYAPEISEKAATSPTAAPVATPATNAVSAIALAGLGGTNALAGAPFAGFAGVFSRLGSLLYREPGMPDVRQLFEPGEGLDAILAKLSGTPQLQAQAQMQMQAQWQAMRLSAERLTPESIRMAVFSAMGSETSLGRIRNPAPLDPKQLLHQLLKAVTDAGEIVVARVQQDGVDGNRRPKVHLDPFRSILLG
jgi:hypothetical protein